MPLWLQHLYDLYSPTFLHNDIFPCRNFPCLNDKPGKKHEEDLPFLHRYPGVHYSTDEQCLFDFGKGYKFCTAVRTTYTTATSCLCRKKVKVVTNLKTGCNKCLQACTASYKLLEHVWNKRLKTCRKLDKTCYKIIPTRRIESWYNNTLTVLCCQLCDNLVTKRLYQNCYHHLETSLIFSSSSLQVALHLLTLTCDKEL